MVNGELVKFSYMELGGGAPLDESRRTFFRITSYALIRSVATKSSASGSDVAYTSRTFPWDTRVRPLSAVEVTAMVIERSVVVGPKRKYIALGT